MEPTHWEDIEGNDGNTYRIKLFDEEGKITSAINLITFSNGEPDENNVYNKTYPQGTLKIEILEQLRLIALSANFG